MPTQVIQNQRDFIRRLLSGNFGELADYFNQNRLDYQKFKTTIRDFCDSQLQSIEKKWAELASQPILH